MRCRCRVLRLRPKGWMCRHHQMPRGRRRLGDVRRNNGTPRHRPRELAHRCRSLFNRRPKRLTRPDSSEMAPGRCGFSQAPLAECGRLSVAGCWHRADTRPCCTRCGRRHCGYWPTGMGRYDSRSSELSRTRCCCDCWMAVVLCQCHRWVLRCGRLIQKWLNFPNQSFDFRTAQRPLWKLRFAPIGHRACRALLFAHRCASVRQRAPSGSGTDKRRYQCAGGSKNSATSCGVRW